MLREYHLLTVSGREKIRKMVREWPRDTMSGAPLDRVESKGPGSRVKVVPGMRVHFERVADGMGLEGVVTTTHHEGCFIRADDTQDKPGELYGIAWSDVLVCHDGPSEVHVGEPEPAAAAG